MSRCWASCSIAAADDDAIGDPPPGRAWGIAAPVIFDHWDENTFILNGPDGATLLELMAVMTTAKKKQTQRRLWKLVSDAWLDRADTYRIQTVGFYFAPARDPGHLAAGLPDRDADRRGQPAAAAGRVHRSSSQALRRGLRTAACLAMERAGRRNQPRRRRRRRRAGLRPGGGVSVCRSICSGAGCGPGNPALALAGVGNAVDGVLGSGREIRQAAAAG
jgi:hypothetical protein